MNGYFEAVGAELKKSWWNAIVIVVFTIARLFVGYDWFKAGWEKLSWFSDGKVDSAGLIGGMVSAIQHSHGPDPLRLNYVLVWFANHFFIPMGGFTDFLVVAFEILIGVLVFFGFGFVLSMVAALFLNLQYAAAGAANNFGYLVTDIVWLQFSSYASLIGVDGYLRYLRGQNLIGKAGPRTRKGTPSRDEDAGFSSPRRGTPAKM